MRSHLPSKTIHSESRNRLIAWVEGVVAQVLAAGNSCVEPAIVGGFGGAAIATVSWAREESARESVGRGLPCFTPADYRQGSLGFALWID
jgi:hypothetical protein